MDQSPNQQQPAQSHQQNPVSEPIEDTQPEKDQSKQADPSKQNQEDQPNGENSQQADNQPEKQEAEVQKKESQEKTALKVEQKQQKTEAENKLPERPISVQYGMDTLQMQEEPVVIQEDSIKIDVPSSEERGNALKKHTFYTISGTDKHGSFIIERRFSEFEALRRILLERWPGCFVPTLSDKTDIKNENLKNTHKRKHLQQFLMKIALSEFIYYKEEVQLFLRSVGMDMNDFFESMPVLKVKDVIERFKASFEQEVETTSTATNASYITHFSTSLKKVLHSLGDLSKKSLRLAESYDYYRSTLPRFSKIITNYEQFNLSEYAEADPNMMVALRDSDKKLDKFKVLDGTNIFYDFYFTFQAESRDAEAMIDIILAMEMFNIKKEDLDISSKETRLQIDQICLGHKSMKVMTSRKTKEEVLAELEEKEKQMIAERHSINELSNIAEIVLATKTIQSFKKMKTTNYFKLIKLWAESTGALTEQLYSLWKFLEDESSAQLKKDVTKVIE